MRFLRNLLFSLIFLALAGTVVLFGYFQFRGQSEKALLSDGLSLMEQGNYRLAREKFAQAQQYENKITRRLSSDSLEEDLYKYSAICDFRLGDLDEAASIYDRLLRIHPTDPILMESRATVYAAQGDMDQAVSLFDMAIEIDRRNYSRIYTAALTLREYGNEKTGAKYLNKLLDEHEDKIDSLTRGQVLCFLGRYKEAVSVLGEIPNPDTQTSLMYASALQQSGSNEEALEILSRLEDEVSSSPQMLDLKGASLCGLGRYEEGLACFEEALPLAQDGSALQRSILSNRISAVENMRQFDRAKELAAEFEKLFPKDGRMIRENKFLQTR